MRNSYALVVASLLGLVHCASLADQHNAEFIEVAGGGGIPLNVAVTGPVDAQGILFVHGTGQSYLSWDKQFNSGLRDDFRLVAFDLRGHGNSAKPWQGEAYADTKLWADDIAAVIAATGLEKPILVGWSLGGYIVLDYVRHYGSESIGGIVFVGSYGGLIKESPATMNVATREAFRENRPLQRSQNIRQNISAAQFMTSKLTEKTLDKDFQQGMIVSSYMMPSYVRRNMSLRPYANLDLLESLSLPIVVAVGARDLSRDAVTGQTLTERLQDARFSLYPDVGHSPFAEDPVRFNLELRAIASAGQSRSVLK